MSATEIQQLAREISTSGAFSPHWCVYLIAFAVVAAGAFFGAYLGEKGKNTATKEDIAEITKLIESVRSEYSQKLEALKVGYQLRAAALERRLATHQQGYALWRKLVFSIHNEKVHEVVHECETWWTNNCLYLTPNARSAFKMAIMAANNHTDYLKGGLGADKIRADFATIENAGEELVIGADLPPLLDEADSITPKDNSPKKAKP